MITFVYNFACMWVRVSVPLSERSWAIFLQMCVSVAATVGVYEKLFVAINVSVYPAKVSKTGGL